MSCAFRTVSALLSATLLFGCVENKPFRMLGIDDKNYHHQKPYFDEVPLGKDRSFRISFVEFDEKGDFWDRRQLGRVNRSIRQSEKPVLLVIYIHGWHHNADDRKPGGKNPGDVQTFRCLLSELAVSASTEDMQVHGVYLGWRGRLVQGPLDYLTFLNRKAAATRVAGTPVTETIFELIRQARKKSATSKCVVIGHSFGALVLEKAMAQALTGNLFAQDVESHGKSFNAPADLILLVNSASESIYAKEMSDMLVRVTRRGAVSGERPLLVSITSESDSATSHWFPVGTFLPNLLAHRRYHWDAKYGAGSNEVDQNRYLTSTPGHNQLLFTHRVDPTQVTGAGAVLSPAPARTTLETLRYTQKDCVIEEQQNPAFEENLQRPRGMIFATGDKNDPGKLKWWEITSLIKDQRSPYWIMHVPDEIIHEHAPIFTPAGRALMAALFRISNPKDTTGARQIQLAPETKN
jgi:hypothetical protein